MNIKTKKHLAAAAAAILGSMTSAKKKRSSRLNGLKGGNPSLFKQKKTKPASKPTTQ